MSLLKTYARAARATMRAFALGSCLLVPSLALALPTPGAVAGVESAQSTIEWSWSAVDGAVAYEVTVDGLPRGQVSGTSYTSTGHWQGEHSLTVKAVDSSGNLSIQSATAIVIVSSRYDPANPGRSDDSTGPSSGTQADGQTFATRQNFVASDAEDTGLIDPSTSVQPDVQAPDGYRLVFSDEFDGQSLNTARWNGQLRWDGEFNGERYEYRVINGEDQFYVNPVSKDQEHLDKILPTYNPLQFDGSRLAIRAKKNPLKSRDADRNHGALSDIVAQQTFLSGAISTYDKFTQKYGYFEARIKIPSHVGTFPAFWLHHQRRSYEGTQRTEIDIMENLGHAPWYIYNSFHYNTNVARGRYGNPHFLKPEPSGQIYTGTDYSENYHVYAVRWEPGYAAWYIDGQKVSELRNPNLDHEDLYIILNLAMGGSWTNFPTNSGGLGRDRANFFPNANDLATFQDPALEIDYVRVYARN